MRLVWMKEKDDRLAFSGAKISGAKKGILPVLPSVKIAPLSPPVQHVRRCAVNRA
ncbi:hypothetical protein [Dickeya chrysanthemi]|uniref:Uncharacterized protein n=1 Tax=Dickeya chrysanthemi TaxID=556 RepID=A0ABU8JPD4_DICCH|nr:hypothetical protein [Dickeya chrysanthemi]MCA7005813.1 hypothetical protein [Dickeya chrysanthemi]